MQENFGGDPLLVSEMGAAATLGMQGTNRGPNAPIGPRHLHSEAKHYATCEKRILSRFDSTALAVSLTRKVSPF